MSAFGLRHRFLWRLRAPADPDGVRRVERWLASARVFLAVTGLIAVWMDPSEVLYSVWAFGLLAFYIAQGMIIIIFLRRRQTSTPSFRLLVHSADIVWPTLVLIFTTGQGTPFFLFFVFVLAAAAYRWGMWETVGTAGASVALLWLESLSFHWGLLNWIGHTILRFHLPPLRVDISDFEPKHLFLRSAYLLVMGFLLGYLAEQEKQLRAEKAVIAGILARIRVESGLSGTLREILHELAVMYGASRVLIASEEARSYRVFLADLQPGETAPALHWIDSSIEDRDNYLYPSQVGAWYALSKSGGEGDGGAEKVSLVAIDRQGSRLKDAPLDPVSHLRQIHNFRSLACVSFTFGQEWAGRIFLFNPTLAADVPEELRFLQQLVRQVGPAIYNVYLLSRLRQRAGAAERARFARELHDGAVQSLIAVEMQVDVLRRQAAGQTETVSGELARIQGLLREEVLKLRELMQQMKSLDVDARKLLPFITDTVERFQRETGIAARFFTEVDEVDLPQRTCRELARILQEGLVNVRKHSRARQVLVRMTSVDGSWRISIEDDGQGFPFAGRLTLAELEALRKGPMVIQERVHLIGGQLAIESNPGRGSRLEIIVPVSGT